MILVRQAESAEHAARLASAVGPAGGGDIIAITCDNGRWHVFFNFCGLFGEPSAESIAKLDAILARVPRR